MVDDKIEGNFEHCPPKPEAMISSLRAFGYDLSMAIADLIDNSIFAGAKNIEVDYDWNDGKPWIRIIDDGGGMSESCLKDAMRLGSQSPLKERDTNDLGRFGLGLKTASFSQCRLLTVKTKLESGEAALRCWDLDHVVSSNRWELSTKAPYGGAQLLNCLDPMTYGTVVLWQKLDRVVQEEKEYAEGDLKNAEEHFNARFKTVAQYLEIVFHRYLAGKNVVKIEVGRHECRDWDPFLTGNQFTQELSTERFDDGRVVVTPYILPHVSKRTTQETEIGAGLHGWNAHQGFYIYRNRRMIIPGGYLDFDFTPEEHFKLCRIQVDIPNNLDHDWSIDVRKATASPPAKIRGDLERIAKATRAKAVQVYRARTGNIRNVSGRSHQYDVWIKKRRGEKILYRINLEHPIIEEILNEVKPKKSWVRKLFHLIENTVPHRVIIQDNAEHEDCHVDLPFELAKPPDELLELCCRMFQEQIRKGKKPQDAADFVCAMFDDHIAYRTMLDKLIEEMIHE